MAIQREIERAIVTWNVLDSIKDSYVPGEDCHMSNGAIIIPGAWQTALIMSCEY